MANPDKGEFDLSFGDTVLTFKMGTSALIEAQEQLGRETGVVPTLEELMRDVLERQRLGYVRAFLWGGLRKHHPEKTVEDVTELLDAMTQDQAVSLLRGLTSSTRPDAKDVAALVPKDGPPRPQKAQAGQRRKARATGDGASISPLAPSV